MVVRVLVAVVLFLVILSVGIAMTRAMSAARVGRGAEKDEPEDVADLSVFFVCRECGTEFQVTRLGEVQVPRHCGEQMEVLRRPASGAASLN